LLKEEIAVRAGKPVVPPPGEEAGKKQQNKEDSGNDRSDHSGMAKR